MISLTCASPLLLRCISRSLIAIQRSLTIRTTMSTSSALVTPAHIVKTNPTLLDATWYKPSESNDPYKEYLAEHIQNAHYFDIDAPGLAAESSLAHMMDTHDNFNNAVRQLGVSDGDVVIYSRNGFIASARAWWMFRLSGKKNVYVLDGGLNAWKKENGPLSSGAEKAAAPGDFVGQRDDNLYRTMSEMLQRIQDKSSVILDARSRARFDATSPEPRASLMGGHMPGATSLPYSKLITSDGFLKSNDQLRDVLKEVGVEESSLSGDVSLTCGSGVTAAIICLALHELGYESAVYDGSWTEYGAHHENPVERL